MQVTNSQSPSPLVLSSSDAAEELNAKGNALHAPGSPNLNTRRRQSSTRLGSITPTVLIRGWLLSFSHYIALYAMLVARLGTRSDCRKLRAKSEVVRRRSVNYARKCQDSLLPVIIINAGQSLNDPLANLTSPNADKSLLSRRGSRKSNLEDYYQLFFLHCSCLEFFIGQLLRTAHLFQCFSLNIGRSLTSSLVAPPPNFIYSGLAEVERPRKKLSQILPRLSNDDRTNFANDSLAAIEAELASRTSCAQTPSGETENHSSEQTGTGSTPIAVLEQGPMTSGKDGSGKGRLKRIFRRSCFGRPPTTATLDAIKSLSSKHDKDRKKKTDPPVLLAHGETKNRITESDTECFEKLTDNITLIRGMIMEIHANVPMNPWVSPYAHDRNKRRSGVDSGTEVPLDDEKCSQTDESLGGENDEVDSWFLEDCDFVIRRGFQRISDSHTKKRQFRYQNTALRRWQRHLRSAWLVRAILRNGTPVGFEEKSQENDETMSSKRLRRRQYICLSLIIFFLIGIFGSALGSCIYLLA